MVTIKGMYSTAKVFTDTIEENACEQIKQLCDQQFVKDCRIRIMPDVHAGAGCVIGFTANLGDIVIPNIVGVDIGCGMLTAELGKTELSFEKLDNIIRSFVPSSKNVHEGRIVRFPELLNLHCYRNLEDTKRIERSLGTLGGGNHFIEVDKDEENNYYLIIHTGSRNLGKQVAEYYQQLAYDICRGKDAIFKEEERIIKEYKETGRRSELQNVLKELRKSFVPNDISIPKELCYLTGEYRLKYLDDMKICQRFASLNRLTIAESILFNLFGTHLAGYSYFETVHNYIDIETNIVRKGAVSAKKGEKILIPINMRDGSLICIGKGNEDWNNSSPHGAGRLHSRMVTRDTFTIEEFEKEMNGIYTTSISQNTLDECPMAYKRMDEIVDNITPTAYILKRITPVYNFKADD